MVLVMYNVAKHHCRVDYYRPSLQSRLLSTIIAESITIDHHCSAATLAALSLFEQRVMLV